MDELMNIKLLSGFLLSCISFGLWADDSYFCPQKHAYIKVGMTTDEVIAACGQPVSQQESNQPMLQKIPVQQLIYNNKGTQTAFYGVWNIPTGSGGTGLEVDIVNNKIKAIRVGGSSNNAFSICQGIQLQIGDPVGKVYGACGGPALVNNTFINQVVPTQKKPQVWIYEPSQYQPTVSLTFVNGKLQSINQ